jgi:hypothetical protein
MGKFLKPSDSGSYFFSSKILYQSLEILQCFVRDRTVNLGLNSIPRKLLKAMGVRLRLLSTSVYIRVPPPIGFAAREKSGAESRSIEANVAVLCLNS